MAAARKTTSTTRATSTAKADDTAKVEDTAKTEDTKATEEAQDNSDEGGITPADQVEGTVVRNPELDGGVDKVKDGQEETERLRKESGTEDEVKRHEETRKAFLSEGKPTTEAWEDPNVNLADVPANHDPVVADDHTQASRAAQVKTHDIEAAAPRQISQFDNSTFGTNVLDALSHTADVKVKGDDSDK